ncbi:hypothetical protein EJV47_25815 [Hymenobacter gummosus]|uniref:Tc1-like transposase DDE domain-containing protein n=1 Tax=Hymenobacter gummosus TaxID=1776032 RepID=A0A431TVA4_9BACT|nr:hypothetical protein EJV47_25815 [Hymenobacter gummosus]
MWTRPARTGPTAAAPAGARVGQGVPLHSEPNVTLIAALTPTGLGATTSVGGAVNGDVFALYLDQILGPTLRASDVVVLDNLPTHKVEGLAALVEQRASCTCRRTRLTSTPSNSPSAS